MKCILVAACAAVLWAAPSAAASLSKTYSYFTIGGTTLDALQEELDRRGPQVKSTGRRHPGATRMQFATKLKYAEAKGYCRIASASVTVTARIILPRWKERDRADVEVRNVWDTLSRDIKRHEEAHVVIAMNHAREIEAAVERLGRNRSCDVLAEKAASVTSKILATHDRKQSQFDRIEGINFESRMSRLLQYQMERIGAGKRH